MSFKVIYASEFFEDLQNAVGFYNSRKKGLGTQFYKTVKDQLSQIKINALGFQVRYENVRCMPLNKFPYTIHYKADTETKTIKIIAIFCDYLNPEIWDSRLG